MLGEHVGFVELVTRLYVARDDSGALYVYDAEPERHGPHSIQPGY